MVYAQYRLGAELIGSMPPDMKRTIGRFRQLYDMGLHGPELLLYRNQGQKFRQQTGAVFFERVCRAVRMDPSEGAMAYLYGLIVHYAISSVCGPFIERKFVALSLPVQKIRGEFDRYLLEKDGKIPPHRYDRSRHIHLTPGECETVAMFYPGISPGTVGKCVKRMGMVMRLSAKTEGTQREVTARLLRLSAGADGLMETHPDHRLRSVNGDLERLYELAKAHVPSLLDQIQIRLHRRITLGPDFSLPFA